MLRKSVGLKATVTMAAVGVAVLLSGASRPAVKAADSAWHRVENWPQMPANLKFGTVSGVAVDKKGVVYVFERNKLGDIWMFDKSGKYLGEWGPSGKPGFVKMAHTIHTAVPVRLPQSGAYFIDRGGNP